MISRPPDQEGDSSLTPGAALAALGEMVGDKLVLVEEEIHRNFRSPLEPVDEAGRYLIGSGGKRLRPALVLLTSGMLGFDHPDAVLLGAALEIIHTASLVHDDIIDGADLRRGQASANRVFGNQFTVLLGDYLYIRSMNMALRTGKLRIIDILAQATERMIEGEMLGHRLCRREDVSREQHLAIVERKTAWLFSACCQAPAVLAGADETAEQKLRDYGYALGIAFQLIDDLLDLTGDQSTVGKPVASDLCEGRMTLPWIDLMECGSAEEQRLVRSALSTGRFEDGALPFLRRALDDRGCLARTRTLAAEHAARAHDLMVSFPAGPFKALLRDLPEAILQRDR